MEEYLISFYDNSSYQFNIEIIIKAHPPTHKQKIKSEKEPPTHENQLWISENSQGNETRFYKRKYTRHNE